MLRNLDEHFQGYVFMQTLRTFIIVNFVIV